VAAGPVMLLNSIQQTYHNRTAKQPTHSINTEEEKEKESKGKLN